MKKSDPNIMARKCNIASDQSNGNNDVRNEIISNTKVLKSYFCDYINSYILVKGDITIIKHRVTQVAFQNCAPFTKCIIKIVRTTIGDAEDLDLVMMMYRLLEYSSNYSDMTGSLWFCSKDEATDFNANIGENNVLNLWSMRLNY